MVGTARANPIGFLDAATCNQDENHFNWILAYLLNADESFRRAFLERLIGLGREVSVTEFVANYQQSAMSSRPDLKVRFRSSDGKHLIFVETKVQSPVDPDQLKRHREGLAKEKWLIESPGREASTALVLLAPRQSIPASLAPGVTPVAWEDVHDMLIAGPRDELRGTIAIELAQVLEVRGLADFPGFDVEAWRKYLEMRNEHNRIIRQVEDQAANFVLSVRNLTNKAVLEGKAPFSRFETAPATRGAPSEFTIYPKAAWKAQSHWGHVKVLLDDGWVEASCGTWTTRNCPSFLSAVGKRVEDFSKAGWQLWYACGGIESYADLSSWKSLLGQKVTEISLLRNRELATEKDLLSSPQVVNGTFEDLSLACQFLIGLVEHS